MKKCVNILSGNDFAVKIMRNSDEEKMMAAQNEYNILKHLKHKNIVEVYDFIVTEREIYTIMELVEGDELLTRISEFDKYDE